MSNNISITSKHEDKIIVTQISIENKTIYVSNDKRFIYNGDIQSFKAKVAENEDSVLGKVYSDILSLAEEVIEALAKGR